MWLLATYISQVPELIDEQDIADFQAKGEPKS